MGAIVINISYNRWIWGLLLLIFHIIGGCVDNVGSFYKIVINVGLCYLFLYG
jgi:hypothetical protein